MSEKITLSGVPETMLQTVYARAKETKTRGAITDNKAVEIIDRLDYDFSMADKDAAMLSGVIARTIVLDKLVKTYLAGHGGAVVVNIACGLDTRCYRMSGYSHWYNLDLPETIAVREKLLPESRKISQIAMSAMDDWGGEIKGTSTDVLVIIEGLTMYLSESDVKRIFDVIAARFDRVTVLVETMNPMVVKRFKEKSIEASKAKFTWGAKNGAALAALLPDFHLVEEHSLCEGMAEFAPVYKLLGKIPAVSNISNRIVVLEKKRGGISMIWSTVWVEAVVFTALFTALVMIPTIKHPEIGVHNYPPDIQEEYFKTYEHVPVAPLSGRTIAFKGFGIVLFTVLLTYGAILAGADSFWTGAEFAAILFLIVGAWDMFFLDWVLFAHLKVFRLPGTEHMDKAYAQKWFHVKGMLFPGSLFLVIISMLTGLLVMWVK